MRIHHLYFGSVVSILYFLRHSPVGWVAVLSVVAIVAYLWKWR